MKQLVNEMKYWRSPTPTNSWATVFTHLLTSLLFATAIAFPSAASAGTVRPYEGSFGSFPSDNPKALAVDQSNGDVYGLSEQSGTGSGNLVKRFDSSGAPKNFTAGPGAGTNTIPLPGSEPADIAIDNSGGPLNGDIYVADKSSGGDVKIFGANGEPLGALTGSGTPEGTFRGPTGLTVDQGNGDVYVAELFGGMIWRFRPTLVSGSLNDADYTVTGMIQSTSLASTGNKLAIAANKLYMVDGQHSLLTYELGAFVAEPKEAASASLITKSVWAVSTDPETGEIYADEGHRVSVFDGSGTVLSRFGASAYQGNSSVGIAVKSASSGPASKVYLGNLDRQSNSIVEFGGVTYEAVLTHRQVAAFGSDGSNGSSFGSEEPQDLGFDQATRRLIATVGGSVFGFDASSPPTFSPLAGFSPLATAASASSVAVDNTNLSTAGNFYIISGASQLLYGFDSTGSTLSGFPVDPAVVPGPPNGSPKELGGVAVDSEGNVWVSNRTRQRILEYGSSGQFLGVLNVSAQDPVDQTNTVAGPHALAFDSNDDLFVSLFTGIWKYTASSGYTAATKFSGSEIGALAVDPTNDRVFVANGNASEGWVDEYDSAGNFVEEFAGVPEIFYKGLAVDSTNHYVYAADWRSKKIRVFAPGIILPEVRLDPAGGISNMAANLSGVVSTQGVTLEECHFDYVTEAAYRVGGFTDLSSGGSVPCSPGAGSIPTDLEEHEVSASIDGLTKNTTYHVRLIVANANGEDSREASFTTSGPPLAETTGSPIRTATTVQLEGRVDPRTAPTSYRFEYGDQGPCDTNPCTSVASHPAGSGSGMELVSQPLEGLAPGTTYHYRVIADNGNSDGPAFGDDMTVTTRSSEAPLSHGAFPGPPASDRAWEQVNLPDTGGNPVSGASAIAVEGDRAIYSVNGGTPTSTTGGLGVNYFAQREVGGWNSLSTDPPRDELVGTVYKGPDTLPDLSRFVVLNVANAGPENTFWRLGPGQAPQKLFAVVPPQEYSNQPGYVVSADATRVVAGLRGGALDPSYPAAATNLNLYDVDSATPKLVSLLPGDTVAVCGVGGAAPAFDMGGMPRQGWLSSDGSLLFFPSLGNACAGQSQLYMRDLQGEETKLVSGPALSGQLCSSAFIRSTPDAAFFWTQTRLVANDSASAKCDTSGSSPADGDVYRYDLGDGALRCVTCFASAPPADVSPGRSFTGFTELPNNVGVAADGTRVYFTSPHRLTPGAPSSGGVYRVDVASGALRWIVGNGVSAGDSSPDGHVLNPDGSLFAFRAKEAALNPLGAGRTNGGTYQYYLYDDNDRSLACVSCPADGSAPVSDVSSSLGGSPRTTPLADDGTFAFVTSEALIGADQNTARTGQDPNVGNDVYEWRDGRQLLVTDGLTASLPQSGPQLNGINPSGRDIFFTQAAQLTPDALDGYRRLYDARIGGGFEFPPAPKPCPLEVCQGTPKGAPEEASPGSAALSGPGNAHQRSHRPRKKKGHRKRRHHKAHAHHKTSRNRRAAR